MQLCSQKSSIRILSVVIVVFLTSTAFVFAADFKPDPHTLNYFALEYINEKNYNDAVKFLDWAIELDPDNGPYYFNRGYAYEGLKKYDKAILDYTEAIRLTPDHWPSYLQRGTLYFFNKDCDNAIKDLSKTVELEPEVINAYNLRGLCYRQAGSWTKACSDFKKACQLGDCSILNTPEFKEKCN